MEENKLFKADAKQIVDMLFDAKLFKESITRDHMNTLEELVKSIMQSRFDSHIKMKELSKKINNLK
jgi:hypothetical protein